MQYAPARHTDGKGGAELARITEAKLAALWRSGALRGRELRDAEGRRLVLLHQGITGSGGGPDFREAAVLWPDGAPQGTGDGPCIGDIELHTDSRLWRQHGHQFDPAFNGVILHVVAGHRPGTATLLEDGHAVPVLQLGEYLETRPRRPLIAPPCRSATRKYPEHILDSLRLAGEERFRLKVRRLSAEIGEHGPGQALYSGIMDGLGYSRNRAACRDLAARLPLTRLEGCCSVAEREALLLGGAGLLPGQRPGPAATAEVWPRQLEDLWAEQGSMQHKDFASWDFLALRPANSPVRRLAAMARLAGMWRQGMARGLSKLVEDSAQSPPQLPDAALIVPADGYWVDHRDFDRPFRERGRSPALLGASRAGEIAVNVLLPFAVAWSRLDGDSRPGHAAAGLYATHPALGGNRETRFMEGQLWHARKPTLNARLQQGLIHVYREFCKLGRCQECPLKGPGV